MSALDIAEHHLTEALSRLERALAMRLSAVDPNQTAKMDELLEERAILAQSVDSLQQECARLSASLNESEKDRENLRRLTDGIARRLDDTIDGLNRVIEE